MNTLIAFQEDDQIEPSIVTPVTIFKTIQVSAFYAVCDETKQDYAYSIVKVINMTEDKLNVSQYGRVFKHLPKFINNGELGQSIAQYWIDKNEFASWHPSLIECYEPIGLMQ